MKKIYTSIVFICLFFIACHHKKNTEPKEDVAIKSDKKISKRDLSIDSSNSYNDLFLDGTVVDTFINARKLNDEVARRVKSFYNARNFQFAWFSSTGLTEQALAFWNLHSYATYSGDTALTDSVLQKKMDWLISSGDSTISSGDKSIVNAELLLTQHFIEYSLDNYAKGYVKRKELERFIPIKKDDPMAIADSLLNHKHKDKKYFEDVNESYKLLKSQLESYYQIAKNGGWQTLPIDPELYKKNASLPIIAALKKRLQLTGDMAMHDTSQLYDDTLDIAIKHFQQRFGYTADGKISASILKDMNIPVMERIEQILVNMNRMRWMPQEPSGKLILVNIPEFVLHVVDGKNKIFDMNVVVGKEGHNTMMFTGKLSQVVFSPYWTLPASIVKKEILPAIKRNKRYLTNHKMEIISYVDGLPRIRQKPGGQNSLGRVKFLFPNSFDIYFHDTPAKSLFSKDKRAYSHGCIRLSDPPKMAEYLLKDDAAWPPDSIMAAMNRDVQKVVNVKDPVPVFITYYTAWVSDNGQLNFRDDIYGRDADVGKKMFQ